MENKIYLRGSCHGLYGKGDKILAVRDDSPNVKKGEHYTIKKIDDSNGSCGKALLIILEEVEGLYPKKTFKVDRSCLEGLSE